MIGFKGRNDWNNYDFALIKFSGCSNCYIQLPHDSVEEL